MKRQNLLILFALLLMTLTASAQRFQDKLDRGLIAVKISGGVYVNWRMQADEYYDVKYNLYRNGAKIAENLNVSNYTDAQGLASSKYSVAAVVNGKELTQSAAAGVWNNNYLEIVPKHDSSLKSTYVPNDACCADVDGVGQVEILMKYDNASEIGASYPKGGYNGEYSLFECLKLDGTVLWWVNCGPNMGDFQNNEQNIVAYDWDRDGKAEAIFRAADGTTIHMADGTVYTVGDASINYRGATGGGANWFMHDGAEYLLYVNGATGKPYQCIEYPLKRLEAGETNLEAAWGDGYGHRSSKHFFGAPYLDGRNPSIFLGRGIYTRHKFVTYDVDPATHALKERWRWTNNAGWSSPWYGQGYHNYAIADVDMDGRDEIVWGSMVIDDNGKGLSTSGLGHGDAQHHGDFDPYTWGLEGYFCNEDHPGNNFRDLTTAKLYYRNVAGDDDGRSIMGKFLKDYPGAQGSSARDYGNALSSVTRAHLPIGTSGMSQNFRCYWDGDLCEETFNYSNGKNTAGVILKPGSGATLTTLTGSMTNNDTKGTPCYMGDIFGDWREEFIMRTGSNNIRIYTTTYPTQWRNYSLWYDHQYRNGMVWQMCGYNQPPHASYFLGEMENITMAPPSLTMTGRTEVANGGTISHNGEQVITCETNDMTVNVTDGATPYIYIDNAPSWVQGYAASESKQANTPSLITYKYYTHTLKGGAFAGDMKLVKQGEGTLVLPAVVQTYKGDTEVWGGKLSFDGTLQNSALWLNRHTALLTNGGVFNGGIEAEYNANINPGGENSKASMTVSTLTLNMGAKLTIDIYGADKTADNINMTKLVVNHNKSWQYGPEFLTPVINFVPHLAAGESMISAGKYFLGTLSEVTGNLSDIVLNGLGGAKGYLVQEDGNLYLEVEGLRDAKNIEWTAAVDNNWDLANTHNFTDGHQDEIFVSGDVVEFNDEAANTAVNIAQNVAPDTIRVNNNSKEYTFSGPGVITDGVFVKEGTGTVTMSGDNTYKKGNFFNGGVVKVSKLANSIVAAGNLGAVNTSTTAFLMSNGAELQSTAEVTLGSPFRVVGNKGGVINNAYKFTMEKIIYKGDNKAGSVNRAVGNLTKKGNGELVYNGSSLSVDTFFVQAGTVTAGAGSVTANTYLTGSPTLNGTSFLATPIIVAKGAKATLNSVNRQSSTNKISGSGQLTMRCITEKGSNYFATRNALALDLSDFEGTMVVATNNTTMTVNNVLIEGRVFTLNTDKGNDKFTLNIPANYRVYNYGKTLRIGKVTGNGYLCSGWNNGSQSGTATWLVGNADNVTLSAIVDSDAKFTKMGTGTMTVGAKWNTTGVVNINEGALVVNGNAKTIGTGAVTVGADGTLYAISNLISKTSANNYPLTNSSYTVNGTIGVASATASAGFLNLNNKNLIINAGGALRVGLSKSYTAASQGSTLIYNINTLRMNDGAKVSGFFSSTFKPTATSEEKADSFYVFEAKNVNIGAIEFELPDLMAFSNHNYWDTSRISEGLLFIRYSDSYDAVTATEMADDQVNVNVVSVEGKVMGNFKAIASQVQQKFSRMPFAPGLYVLDMKSATGKRNSIKLSK